ncbi:Pentaxin family protein [Colwellia chukchiensis]|uniref:Pentaxin family protein n=1 Tax=Colwellia chukchiensis TaxID=641665 RepID=A0A1H7L9I3_9GAMM|nr:LamG domain-containing protein [Colwellia chukchiensis]SEK95629.1 Pentaxin family protein [Colwellia chukchiensis]
MMRFVFLIFLLMPLLVSAATSSTDYDFANRSPGHDIFAYYGISGTQLATTNNTPSNLFSTADYSDIAANDNTFHRLNNKRNNSYPALRFQVHIDENASKLQEIEIFWNGRAVNANNGRTDGARLYIWNFDRNRYELATSASSSAEVSLSHSLTSNLANYVGNNNEIIVYLVSEDKTSGKKSNQIGTDYFRVTITHTRSDPASILANFQFDECAYTGAASEVIDQSGNYSGSSHNNVNTSTNAKIVKALNISNGQQHVQTRIPLPASYSVSTWFKKPTDTNGNRYFILGAMENGGDLLYLDRNNDWRWGVYEGSSSTVRNGNYSFNNLNNDWHHMVLVYSNNTTSLYINGGFIETINLAPSGTLKFIGTSFDDVASANPQGFRAPLDEFMVFSGELSAAEISSIYAQQNSGNNYDGSARAITSCAMAIANFKFDELSYADVANEVLDSIGTYHGQAKNAQTAPGKVCRALDLTASGTKDYVILDAGALDNQSEFSISLWAKTAKTDAQSIVSGASAGSHNELIMWFTSHTKFRPFLQNSQNGTLPITTIAGDTWRHLVWTQGNNQSCLFIDTVAQGCLNQATNLLDIQSLILGQEQDSVGNRFDASQAFNGLLDELVIFDGVIDQDKINQIYNYQNNGLGLNGEQISCPSALVAQYSMESVLWQGSQGEVIDETGRFNGQALSAVTANTTPALTGNPGTCRYGSFDGVDDYIEVPDTGANNFLLDLPKALSVSVWINPTALPSSGLKTIISKDENYEFHLLQSGEIHWWWQTHSFSTSGANITAGNWYHIAITYENGRQVIYVNGVAKGTRNFTGELILNDDPLQIGQDQGIASRFFAGFIDEVHIYDGALSASEVNDIYNKRHACAEPAIHHYEIVHDGNGLTCAAEPITIKACTNSSCSTLSTEPVSLDFTLSSATAGNVIKASPTFTGSTNVSFNHSTAELVSLSINGATITATHPIKCTGAGASCDMTFTDAGFRFLYGDNNSETIDHQSAGKVFAEVVKLQAVKNNNGVCEGIFAGSVSVSLAQQNVSPNLAYNAGLALQASGTNIAKYPAFTDNINLTFSQDSTAVIPNISYLDAGQIRLHAKYANANINLVGSSNDFWVKPERFIMQASNASGDLTGSNALSAVTHKAGADFNFSVSAVNAHGDITQNYRQSDGQLQLKVARVAPLGNAIDGQFNFASGQTLTTSTAAAFQDVSLSSFSAAEKGKSSYGQAQYNEVGVIQVDVQDINYGGLGANKGLVSAADLTIGRFTPAYFKQTVKAEHQGRLDAYHSAVASCAIADWAYSGQLTTGGKGAISYSLEPKITITSYNTQGQITKNYTLGEPEGFMKLQASGVEITLPSHDDVQLQVGNVAGDFVALTATMSTGSLSESRAADNSLLAGEWLYTFDADDHFSYVHDDTALLAPFAANIPFLTKQITDQDGISLQADAVTSLVLPEATEKLVTEGVKIHFGRMVLANSYGSENAQLRAQAAIEVFDGTNFTVHDQESCLTPQMGAKKSGAKYSGNMNLWEYRLIDINSDAIQVGDTQASVAGTFKAGIQNRLLFSAPGKQGLLEWEYEVPSWLKFKWDTIDNNSDGNYYDDNPSALLNFGVYRGNDRIISWREVSN